jgi:hypothetical protein
MVKDYFHIKEVEPQELIRVLLTHFSQSQTISVWTYKYQKPNSQNYIEVSFDENGKITKISTSKKFPADELELIEKKIHDTLLTNYGTKIDQIICFCDERITGYFRYKNLFQTLPIPDDATKPNVMVASHPFILEIAYEASSDFMINQRRRTKNAVIYTRLLNLLSNQFITIGTRYTQFSWAYNTEDVSNLTYNLDIFIITSKVILMTFQK